MLCSLLMVAARQTMLSPEPGGFGYDTCHAWGEPGARWMGCDEFFPAPMKYKDLRDTVPKGCDHTHVQFVTDGEDGYYPWGPTDKFGEGMG
uniref:Uncharacterized protein n=1 Tax=Hemiselmis andersenii TaxID=464988 RepID=A0A6T8NI36_HEMAN|mmetsp:Transcript_16023/g.36991  ORF Transcript_16023/g.36991 Transcript_16023/m.36991 type:complete len:91 (+) Transcript_16023:49-321(+)